MPSGLRKTSGNHFEIYYEQPWGGVASNKSYVDIESNQLIKQEGVVVVDGALQYFNLVADPIRFRFFGQITTAGQESFPYLICELGGQLYAFDQYGYTYVYSNVANPNGGNPAAFRVFTTPLIPGPALPVLASDGPWNIGADGDIPTAIQVINGLAYIANYTRNSIYVFDPNAFTFNLASDYTGGIIMGVLDDYLLQCNTNSLVDGVQPNRVNWSGPGKFSTWDAAIDRTAGFNTLAAVEDQITGFISLASVGIVISQKGLTELSPTGIAIQPFTFTALWTSEVGQGSIYPKSIIQYGQSTMMATDSGIYKVNTGAGMQDATGAAKRAIFSSWQNSQVQPIGGGNAFGRPPLVAGTVMLYFNNSQFPVPYYVLIAVPESLGQTNIIQVWLMDLTTGIWQSARYNIDDLVNKQYGLNLAGGTVDFADINSVDVFPRIQPNAFAATSFNNVVTLATVRVRYTAPDVTYPVILSPYLFNNDGTSDIAANYVGNLNLIFRGEEIKIDRQPTIRRVVIRAYGFGTLAVSVSGRSFGNIVLDGTGVSKVYLSPTGAYTGQAPQLTITSENFKGVIEKVMLSGTYADGDID